MANTNFKPWLGDGAISDPTKRLQNTYSSLTTVGFQPNGFVKAGDFNAALRMATLVCAGLANALGFDATQTIDSSEAAIAAAIKSPSFTSISTTGAVTAGGALTGASLKIGTTERISSTGAVTASSVDVDNTVNASTIHAVSELSGGEVSSEGDVTASGTVYGDSLDIGGGAAQISSSGDFTGRDVNAKAIKATSITNTGLYSGKNITGTNLTVTNVYGTGGAAPTFQNGATFNDTVKLPSKGTTLQGSYGSGWIPITSGATTFNTKLVLSDSTYSDVAAKKSVVLIRVAFYTGSTSDVSIYYGLFPSSKQEIVLAYTVTGAVSARMTLSTEIVNATPQVSLTITSTASISSFYTHVAIETTRLFDTPFTTITSPT